MTLVIDATDLKVGRICTVAAKTALKGERVEIVNCEKAVFTGDKHKIVQKYEQKRARGGPHWGPHHPRMADRFVRRIVRGMLPYKKDRGKEAFKRVMCRVGNPEDKDAETIDEAHIKHSQTLRYVTVGEVCESLGGKS